jgi:hypothetical protein
MLCMPLPLWQFMRACGLLLLLLAATEAIRAPVAKVYIPQDIERGGVGTNRPYLFSIRLIDF